LNNQKKSFKKNMASKNISLLRTLKPVGQIQAFRGSNSDSNKNNKNGKDNMMRAANVMTEKEIEDLKALKNRLAWATAILSIVSFILLVALGYSKMKSEPTLEINNEGQQPGAP
jgi:preprotein translocase subunit SecG